jgi:peroxiredoxin
MWQAEIAGGRVTSAGELPAKGRLLRSFELRSSSGRLIKLYDYHGRSNLVLVFTDHEAATSRLLTEMTQRYEEFKREEAEIVAVAKCSKEECGLIKGQLKLEFLVLSDEDGRLHHDFGASDQQGNAAAAAYVIDRYAEVFAVYRTRDGQPLPGVIEILNWLEFINSQCPECEPPEWPT